MSMESYLKRLDLKIRLAKERAEKERSQSTLNGMSKDSAGKWSYDPAQDPRSKSPTSTKIK